MFFALNGCGDCGETFEVDEFVDFVFCCVALRVLVGFVVSDSLHQVCGYAYVEALEAACEDVDVSVLVGFHWLLGWL